MIKAQKAITLTIDGEDVKNLGVICELARRRIADYRGVDFSSPEMGKVTETMNKLFEATS